MMDPDTVYVEKINEAFIRVTAEPGIQQEINQFFSFQVPGHQFMASFKAKLWNGYIYLYNLLKKTLYHGLLDSLQSFTKSRDYKLVFTGVLAEPKNHFPEEFVDSFLEELPKLMGGGKEIQARDYQIAAFKYAIQNQKCLLLSPTASGKSLIIYLILRFLLENGLDDHQRVLIVVPTTSLVEQLYTDFEDYSGNDPKWNTEKLVHRLYGGQDKLSKKRILISTWQSIYKEPESFFKNFGAVIGDEAHSFQAKSLTSIMEKLVNAEYRIGTTGTVQDAKVHQLVLEGLFGKIFEVTTTKKLMDNKDIAELKIKCLLLNYDEDIRRVVSKASYADEYKYIITNKKRNKFIAKLALQTKDNTLVLFKNIEHGKQLYNLVTKESGLRKVFLIYGKTDTEEREEIRRITEKEIGAIIIASYGTFSTGVNIKNIYDVIFASPYKSRIKVLQSIGRGLRKGDRGNFVRLYDIADDLHHKQKLNHTLKHFIYRVKLYNEQEFSYSQHKFKL